MSFSRTTLFRIAKLAIMAIVAWGIYGTIQTARRDLAESPISWSDIRWPWMGVAAATYALGLLPLATFWHHLLCRMQQRPVAYRSLRAHVIGHLGKYVPGKALVVILRAALISGPEVDAAVATVASLIESLMMMASGGFVAATIFLIAFPQERVFQFLAVGLMLVTGLPVVPAVTRHLVRLLSSERWRTPAATQQLDHALAQLKIATFAYGAILYAVTWLLFGISLGATVIAIADSASLQVLWYDLPRFVASTSLAMVAGFVSLLPGGVFAREWVFVQMLEGQYGVGVAAVAAVAVRVIWMMTELLLSVILYLWKTTP